jgi:hypothetical protein
LPGSDFISERFTDLGGSEWDFAVVKFEETGEVDEMTLGGLGSEVSVVVS